MNPRTEFTRKIRRLAWDRCGGRCEGCGSSLQPGRFTYDHRIADWLGGDNSLENCNVLGFCCDKPKTANDQGVIAKVKRIRDRRIGALTSKRPMPGSRASGFKKRMDGTVVRR
jgi:5-methylcytosine-specific restriction protein A